MLMPRGALMFWKGLLVALAVEAVAILGILTIAQGQTAPAGFCGKASVSIPRAGNLLTGTAYATSSVSNSAITSAPVPTLTVGSIVGALVVVETSTIRERHDGTSPTALGGIQYGPGAPGGTVFIACGSDLASGSGANISVNLKVTADTTTAALVHWWFYTDGR